jgi:aspartyl-tRNA(Asn)/glutamyl-tRNA(Gln) amidotransferase subunit A
VADAAIIYGTLRGHKSDDTPSESRTLKLAIPRHYFLSALDAQVAAGFETACERLRESGVTLTDVVVPHARDIVAIYLHIVLAEAAAYHATSLERRPEDYTPNVRIRLEMGRYILGEDYARALGGRELIRREIDAALEGFDGLLLPALAIPAPKIGVPTVRIGGAEEPVRNVMLRCTQAFNISGHPAIALPCGATSEGLPISAQIVGAFGDTTGLLRVATRVEAALAAPVAATEIYRGPGRSR